MKTRFRYVDLLRGFAALAVLITHYRWFYAAAPGDWKAVTPYPLPFYQMLWPIYDFGGGAVQFFWVLSGFVFAEAYPVSDGRLDARRFLAYRIARLYPLHIATLLYIAGVQYLSLKMNGTWQVYGNNDATHFVAHLFLTSNWLSMESSFNGPIWSVSVEVFIYGTFLAYALWSKRGIKATSAVTLFFVVTERLTHSPIAWCGALFFIGLIVSNAARYVACHGIRLGILLSLACCLLSMFVIYLLRTAHLFGHEGTVLSYLFAPSLILLFSLIDRSSLPFPAALSWIGGITYSVYLCHMPVILTVKAAIPDLAHDRILADTRFFIGYMAAVLAISYPTYRLFELPAQRFLRKRLVRDKLTPARAAIESEAI